MQVKPSKTPDLHETFFCIEHPNSVNLMQGPFFLPGWAILLIYERTNIWLNKEKEA